jgi:hypothetical protein
VSERDAACAETGEELVGLGPAHPGVDALGPRSGREHSDQAFEAQVRGSVRVQQLVEVGPKHTPDAVAGAESFGFRAAALAGHVGGDAGAVPADVGAVGGFAGKEPFFTAAGAGSADSQCGGEADAADGLVGARSRGSLRPCVRIGRTGGRPRTGAVRGCPA